MKIDSAALARLLGTWASTPGSLYDRLAGALEGAIERGEVPVAAVLPPERELARHLAVSRTTVVRAYGRLKESGRLESRQGRGTWVAPASTALPTPGATFSAELYAGMLGGGGDLIEMTAACPPPASVVAHAVAEMSPQDLARDFVGAGYLPAGLESLRVAVAAHLSRTGLASEPDEILITTGAQQAIAFAVAFLGSPGDAVLVEEATYPGALDIARGARLRPIAVALDRDGVRPDVLENLLGRTRPAFIYLVPAHQNPTGSVLSASRSRRVAELSARYRVPVVEDLTLRHLEMEGSGMPAPIAAHDPDASSMAIGSASKVLWGGLRIGWIRASRPVVERLMRLKIAADLGSPVLAQSLVAALMPRFDEAIAERRVFLRERYRALARGLASELPEWAFEPPRGGCSLWVRIPAGDARALAQVAQRCGVSVVPGPVLSAEGRHEDHLRLPFIHEPPVIAEAVRRLATAWELYSASVARPREVAALVV